MPVLASWGRRAAALLLDTLVFVLPSAVGIALVFVGNDVAGAAAVGGVGFVIMLGVIVAQPLYFTILHGREPGQTLGKRWVGVRVIDADRGGAIGYGRSFLRWFVPALVGGFCGLFTVVDYLWPLWDDRNQTVHDKIANSVVVRTT